MYDALVVGAGPAGCTAARLLADRGWTVALLDENPGPRERVVCSGIVSAEAFDRFSLPEEAVVDTVRSARFVSPLGEEVPYAPTGPLAHVVDRTRFDGALARRAQVAGARLLRGHAARAVEVGPDGVTLEAEVDGGARRRVRGRCLVVATGSGRWLHEEAGLGVPDDYVHGVHLEVPFRELEAAEVHFGRDLAPGWFAWAVPFGRGRARLGLLVEQGGRDYLRGFLRHRRVRSRLGTDPEQAGRHEAVLSRGIVQGAVRPSFADRVLAVGEAAGQVKTTTGGGIYYGMLGAEIAADVLDEGLRADRLARGCLSRYQERWEAALGPEIEAGLRLQRAGQRLADREIDDLFRALNDGLGPTVRRLVAFDWHRAALGEIFASGRFRRLLARAAF